jgi:uncharacterized protein (DUF2236 family)
VVGGGATAQRPVAREAAPASGDLSIGAGLYGPSSEAWRLNREAALLLGAGPLAVLLQVAHPLVAEGVAQHSTFTSDPWARLEGTLSSYLRIVYGSERVARTEIRRLNVLHRTVTGPVGDPSAAARFGVTYAARDPDLSLWVHATLIWATLLTVERWLAPVARERRARFYDETRVVGMLFGVPEDRLPANLEAFEGYVAAMLGRDGPVHPTSTSRELAKAILHPPLAPVVERGGVADALGPAAPGIANALRRAPRSVLTPMLVPAVGLLPDALRQELGLSWGPVERALDAWLVTMWRAWRPLFPPAVRWFPQALAAYARVGVAVPDGVFGEG